MNGWMDRGNRQDSAGKATGELFSAATRPHWTVTSLGTTPNNVCKQLVEVRCTYELHLHVLLLVLATTHVLDCAADMWVSYTPEQKCMPTQHA
jgi:hypothetical protein